MVPNGFIPIMEKSIDKMYTTLVSKILFPVHEKIKGHRTVQCLKQLEKSQWQPIAQIKKEQLRKLRILLKEAALHSPYYRQLFKTANIDIENITSIDVLAAIPLLDKKIIRENFEAIKHKNAKNLIPYRTGGSTGEPLHLLVSKMRIAHDVAAKWRATRWWSVDIGDKELVVWGAGIECQKQSWLRNMRDKMMRSYLIPAKNLTHQEMDKIIHFVRDYKPKMVFGYPSILGYIGKYSQQINQPLNHLGIKVAFVTSEVLDEAQKQTIQKTFGCAVANGYGGRDAGFIAHSCPVGNMHITAEDMIVEIIDENGKVVPPGHLGEVVVTHLASHGFPFIRYRTGDLAVYDETPCSCHRGLPILKDIVGRKSDLIYAFNGAAVHRAEIVKPITAFKKIERFQFVQKTLTLSTLKIKGQVLDKDETTKLISDLKILLGQELDLKIDYVDDLLFEKSGKYKFVISELHQ